MALLRSLVRRQQPGSFLTAWVAATPTTRADAGSLPVQSRVWWRRGVATAAGKRRRRRRLRGIKSRQFWKMYHNQQLSKLTDMATKRTPHFTISRFAPLVPPAEEMWRYLNSGHSSWWLKKYGSRGAGGGRDNSCGSIDPVLLRNTSRRTELTSKTHASLPPHTTVTVPDATATSAKSKPRPKLRWGHPDDLHVAFLTTKRQFGRRAVDRNRARRRLKECARALLFTTTADGVAAPLPAQLDTKYWYVVVCFRLCLSATYEELCGSWMKVTQEPWKVRKKGPRKGAGQGRGGQGGTGGRKGRPTDSRKTWKQIAGKKKQTENVADQRKAKGNMKLYRKAQRERLYGKEGDTRQQEGQEK